ncbi:MAG: HU family DNA-binding protein [Actinomycetota bacterium]|nr:HU family DNA-binding protein [Actinomycetota bacterium]
MNKSELIEALTDRLGDKRAASDAVEGVVDTIVRAVAKGERVAITGFGVFEKRERSARTARNPATGASVKVKKTSVPRFRPGQGFKDVVSGAKKLAKQASLLERTARGAASGAAATARSGAQTLERAAKSALPRAAGAALPSARKSGGTSTVKQAGRKGGQATAKKTGSSSSAAKSTTTKKTTAAKKTASKSTTAKKTASKSTTAKKSTAKKATTKKAAGSTTVKQAGRKGGQATAKKSG